MTDTKPTASRGVRYIRVSRAGGRNAQELERNAFREQRDLCDTLTPRNVELLDDLIDVDASGKTSDRPAFNQLFELAEAGAIDTVIVGYLSRFGRTARDLLTNVERLHSYGVTLISARDGLVIKPGTKGVAKLLLTVLAAVAEMELDRLTEGLGRSNSNAVERGVSIVVPYGYKREDGPGSVLVPDDDEPAAPDGRSAAQIVRDIFSARVDEGLSPYEIARRLDAAAVPTSSALLYARGGDVRGSDHWTAQSVINLLSANTYRGVIPRAIAWSEPTGRHQRRRATAWEYLPGEHVPLVSDTAFSAAQYQAERTSVRNTGACSGALLRGLARCQGCSRVMTSAVAVHPRGQTLIYKCTTRGCPARATITRKRLDAYVMAQLLEGRDQTTTIEIEGEVVDLDELTADLARAEADLESFEQSASPAALGDRYVPAFQRFLKARDNALGALSEAKATQHVKRRVLVAGFEDLPVEDQRGAIASLLDAIVVRSARHDNTATTDGRTLLVARGTAPFRLSGSGRRGVPVQCWPWPEADRDAAAATAGSAL